MWFTGSITESEVQRLFSPSDMYWPRLLILFYSIIFHFPVVSCILLFMSPGVSSLLVHFKFPVQSFNPHRLKVLFLQQYKVFDLMTLSCWPPQKEIDVISPIYQGSICWLTSSTDQTFWICRYKTQDDARGQEWRRLHKVLPSAGSQKQTGNIL